MNYILLLTAIANLATTTPIAKPASELVEHNPVSLSELATVSFEGTCGEQPNDYLYVVYSSII